MNKQQAAEFNRRNIEEFRQTGGTLSSFGNAPVLLLTTVGLRSGKRRTSPMMYLPDPSDPGRVYVFASAAGKDTNPAWFANLVAHPHQLEVEIGRERVTASAEVLAEPERTRVFDAQARRYPSFAAFRAKTTRVIPVVALDLRWQ